MTVPPMIMPNKAEPMSRLWIPSHSECMRNLPRIGWMLSAIVLIAACSSVDNVLETRDGSSNLNSAGTATITGGTQGEISGASGANHQGGAGNQVIGGAGNKGGALETGGIVGGGKGGRVESGGVDSVGKGGGSEGKGGSGGSSGTRAGSGGATGTGGGSAMSGGVSGNGGPDAGRGGASGGMSNVGAGGSAGQGGTDAGASPPCSDARTEAECDARADCHSVFDNGWTCGCSTPGCCMQFVGCGQGAAVDCTGPNLCPKGEPQCVSPYVLSYAGGCVEGCVLASKCTE